MLYYGMASTGLEVCTHSQQNRTMSCGVGFENAMAWLLVRSFILISIIRVTHSTSTNRISTHLATHLCLPRWIWCLKRTCCCGPKPLYCILHSHTAAPSSRSGSLLLLPRGIAEVCRMLDYCLIRSLPRSSSLSIHLPTYLPRPRTT